MESEPVDRAIAPEVLAHVIAGGGDLSKLTDAQRAEYYAAVCKSLGLNPLTQPFQYLWLNGKLRLYALRDSTDQLRRIHGISIYISNREQVRDIYVVTARARDRQGREDESTGAVTVGHLKGDALANALMKAETKAKRRVTLSIAGLGWLDEVEVETLPLEGAGMKTAAPSAPIWPAEGSVHPGLTNPREARGAAPAVPDTTQALHQEIGQALKALIAAEGEEGREGRKTVMQELFGVTGFSQLKGLAPEKLAAGLQELREMLADRQEQDEADVPDVDEKAPGEAQVTRTRPASEALGSGRGDRAATSPTDVTYATPGQVANLKLTAQQVGEDASAEVQDLLAQHPAGLALETYQRFWDWLQARQAQG